LTRSTASRRLPAELAESLFDQERHEGLKLDDSLIAAELAEHGRFQAWRTNRKAVLRAYGWEACAAGIAGRQ
jgi:hypothetical protein